MIRWVPASTWIRVDLVGTFYAETFGGLIKARIERPARKDGKFSGFHKSMGGFMEAFPEYFVMEGAKNTRVAWNLTFGPPSDKYNSFLRRRYCGP